MKKCVIAALQPIIPQRPINPCVPSPCGPNSECRAIGEIPSCSCLTGYLGNPPNCRPECLINAECPSISACIKEKCIDPCPGSCGANALCSVINHTPVCQCLEGFIGDPFTNCVIKPPRMIGFVAVINVIIYIKYVLAKPVVEADPCNTSPCGPNTVCKDGICQCLTEYQGDPYRGCRPECVLNNDCPRDRACLRNKCLDPCPGICGENAKCTVVNHIPTCSCIKNYVGNAFIACFPPPGTLEKLCLSLFLFWFSYFSPNNYKPLQTFALWS